LRLRAACADNEACSRRAVDPLGGELADACGRARHDDDALTF
jgi:hypothetical protein